MKLFMILATVVFHLNAQATAPVPECWTTNGRGIGLNPRGEEIADGQWLIQVDFKNISKEDLVMIMSKVKRGSLNHVGYPMIFEPDFMMLHVEAKDDGSSDRALPRAELRRRANAQVAEIAAHVAVPNVECNGIAYPQSPR